MERAKSEPARIHKAAIAVRRVPIATSASYERSTKAPRWQGGEIVAFNLHADAAAAAW